jgi:hypothetical protein
MRSEVPAAEHVSVLVKATGQEDAYFMALSAGDQPIAQFGWPLQGWKDFAMRILTQVAAFEGGSNLEVPLLMIANEMHMDAFNKTMNFEQFRDHFPTTFVINTNSKDRDSKTITIGVRKMTKVVNG